MTDGLRKNDIRQIIENKGLIMFGSRVKAGSPMIQSGIQDMVVENNFVRTKLTIDVPNRVIVMTRVDNDADGAQSNAVNIRTVDAKATTGSITTPGYVYTGDFSGCVFYLYRTGPDQILGVHAYNGSQPVESRTKYLRRKVSKMVVREYGPTDYFTRSQSGIQLCRYPTRGQMDPSLGEISLGFLSCVDRTTATTFLFGVRGTPQGSRITRLIQTYHVSYN
jgi:hypothetical protein